LIEIFFRERRRGEAYPALEFRDLNSLLQLSGETIAKVCAEEREFDTPKKKGNL